MAEEMYTFKEIIIEKTRGLSACMRIMAESLLHFKISG
jgi:hypothetical protein